jgi:hypothetical protein
LLLAVQTFLIGLIELSSHLHQQGNSLLHPSNILPHQPDTFDLPTLQVMGVGIYFVSCCFDV